MSIILDDEVVTMLRSSFSNDKNLELAIESGSADRVEAILDQMAKSLTPREILDFLDRGRVDELKAYCNRQFLALTALGRTV